MIFKIDSFQGKYRFLSNFYIEPDDTHVEGEYQSEKTIIPSEKSKFDLVSPGLAKKLGRKVTLRKDWEVIKEKVMYDLVKRKFQDHNCLRKLLLETENAVLVEGNTWNDIFWGVCHGKGQNMLGKILMKVREELT